MAKDKEKKKKAQLPEHLELQRTSVVCGSELNKHVSTLTAANILRPMGYDNSWDLEEFKEGFSIKVNRMEGHPNNTMEFDMIGCDPAVANALRRILIAEIPTMAPEHIFMVNNTSIIQDEVLSHRLGLVPLLMDPSKFVTKNAEEAPSEKNTVVFKLDITCRRDPATGEIVNDKVMSSHLKWLPHGSEMPEETSCRFAAGQGHMFPEPVDHPRPVYPDILLAKLRPGQTIQLEAHCTKGTAKEHAKWSPVATAWYRLQPEVKLLKEPSPSVEAELVAAAPGLFVKGPGGKLTVTSARGNEKDLEKVRALLDREEVAETVQYTKLKHHFIFTIESTGIISPEDLFVQALDILADKAERLAGRL